MKKINKYWQVSCMGLILLAGLGNVTAQTPDKPVPNNQTPNNQNTNPQIQNPNQEINSNGVFLDTTSRPGNSNFSQPDRDRLNPVNQNNNKNSQYDQHNPNFQNTQTNPNSQPNTDPRTTPSKAEQQSKTSTAVPIKKDDRVTPPPPTQGTVPPSNQVPRQETVTPPNTDTKATPNQQISRDANQPADKTKTSQPVKTVTPSNGAVRNSTPETKVATPAPKKKEAVKETKKIYLVPDSTVKQNNPR